MLQASASTCCSWLAALKTELARRRCNVCAVTDLLTDRLSLCMVGTPAGKLVKKKKKKEKE
jgi:hypothetical protein